MLHVTKRFAILGALIAIFAAGPSAGVARDTVATPAPLGTDQWTKIEKQLDSGGKTRTLPLNVTQTLGLSKGNEALTVRELAFEREGYQHGLYRSLVPGDDSIILAFRTPDKRWMVFLTDARLVLRTAAVWNAGEPPVQWPTDQALPVFTNELGYWAALAELF